jgi:DNA-binding MarR family transcriptional regulator
MNTDIDPIELNELQQIHNTKFFLRIAGFADIVQRFVDIELKGKVNLLKTWVLAILVAAGGSITPGELQRSLLRTRHSISQVIDSMLKEGLITRYNDQDDRRIVHIQITRQGLSAMRRIYKEIDLAENEIRNLIDEDDLVKLASLIRLLRINLTKKISQNLTETKDKRSI